MPIQQPEERLYVAYTHVPNGQIIVEHRDTIKRRRIMGGDKTEEVIFTAKDSVLSLEKSDYVSIYVDGKLIKNKVMVYDGPPIDWRDPNAKKKVKEWAVAKGLRARQPENMKTKDTASDDPAIRKRIEDLEKGQHEISFKVDRILEAVAKK